MLFRSKNLKTSKMKDPDKKGFDLRETKLWKETYTGGYIYPDISGKWRVFAFHDGRYDQMMLPAKDIFTIDDWDDFRDTMYSCADICTVNCDAIMILCCLYMDPRNDNRSPVGVQLVRDGDFIDWAVEYWSFLKWNERDNRPSVSDFDGWDGFVGAVLYPEDYIEYLKECGEDDLAKRLMRFHRRYGGEP